ncbi:Protein translation factor SUI1-like protein, partial [Dichanthelium oligosanthes]
LAAPRDDVVHLRTQQRNGRKSLTTVQWLSAAYNYAKILRDVKRELCCSGIVVEDEDLGNVVQLQGDHRKAIAAFLVKVGIVTKANVKIHGSNKITELVKRTKLKKRVDNKEFFRTEAQDNVKQLNNKHGGYIGKW